MYVQRSCPERCTPVKSLNAFSNTVGDTWLLSAGNGARCTAI
jgi:hypothetical protein